jgi:mRNA-degrading endonuclease RelE of RelBE toxin-antitoxin system
MYEVLVTSDARSAFLSLPMGIQKRVQGVFERLAGWPDVSGAKPLRHELKGAYRVRTGDWRVLIRINEPAKQVIVFRIAHRREVYE